MKHNKLFKLIALFLAVTCIVCSGSGCLDESVQMSAPSGSEGNSEEDVQITFDALMYDNQGNNYVTFRGNTFNISANKIKQWGYNTSGSWTSWYETSSVVSIEIDGHYVESCGSTVIFKDSRLSIIPLTENIGVIDSSDESGYSAAVQNHYVIDYFVLTNWWLDTHEPGQGGEKIVLIQSQDGYNIGVIEGKDVTWEVAGKLPKTTLITIDNMPLYIHRCNFTIIDTELFDNVVIPE